MPRPRWGGGRGWEGNVVEKWSGGMGQSGVVDWETKKGVVGKGVNEQTLTQRRFFLYFILATENWMET